MLFVVRSDDSFNFPLGLIKYIVIESEVRVCTSQPNDIVLASITFQDNTWRLHEASERLEKEGGMRIISSAFMSAQPFRIKPRRKIEEVLNKPPLSLAHPLHVSLLLFTCVYVISCRIVLVKTRVGCNKTLMSLSVTPLNEEHVWSVHPCVVCWLVAMFVRLIRWSFWGDHIRLTEC